MNGIQQQQQQEEETITDRELDIALGNVVDDHDESEDIHTDDAIGNRIEAEHEQQTEGPASSYDFYAATLFRLQNQDPTLQTLEMCNIMEWGLYFPRDNDGQLDYVSCFTKLADLLHHAKFSPHVIQLELSNLILNYPILFSAIEDLLLHSDRTWNKLSIEDNMGIGPQLFDMLHAANVRELQIANNHLEQSSLIALSDLLSANKSIGRVRITEHFTREATKSFGNALKVNTTLYELNFMGSRFDSDITISELANAIRHNDGIHILSFGYCQLSDSQLSKLIYAIRNHKHLRWLDLNNNTCGEKACNAIEEVFLLRDTTLPSSDKNTTCNDQTSFTLPSVSIASKDATAISTTYITSLPSNLAGLSLARTGIDDDQLMKIVKALANTQKFKIKHLHLGQNNITDKGIQGLVGINTLKHLESLFLSENDFGDTGSQSLLELAKRRAGHLMDLMIDRHLQYFDKIQYQILLNRGGFGKVFQLKDDKDNDLIPSLSLWPLILARCHTVKHCCRMAGPADIIFHLLRGGGGPVIIANNKNQHFEIGSQQ